ncbi:hypothetical protein D3Z52_15095 [Clostridiaceae bacterium]|nr:hypothetical protein [Clostridiaceae bacterium]
MDKNYIAQLYNDNVLTSTGVLNAIQKGWITTEDAVEILGSDTAIDTIRTAKLLEISNVCNAVIVAGIDVQIGERTDHFNLALEDQSNINNLFRVVELGGTEFPYQADDGTCTVYSAQEIAQIYIAAQSHITSQTAYHNALKAYVNSLETSEEITAIQYGMTLPDPYATELAGKLAVAQTQMQAIIARLGEAV